MKTKKTLTVEIEVSAEEITALVIKHLAETNEEFKKVYDVKSEPKINFLINADVFEGCKITVSKTK